jgi:hypothetical protein
MAATINHSFANSLISERFCTFSTSDSEVNNYLPSEILSTNNEHNHTTSSPIHNYFASPTQQSSDFTDNRILAQKPFILLTFNSTIYSPFVETPGIPSLFIGNQDLDLNMTIYDFMTLLQTYFNTENDVTLECKTLNLKFRLHTKFIKVWLRF